MLTYLAILPRRIACAADCPPLNTLRVFESGARRLSFTRAAEELHVTQAAVSHQIKALEDWLGTPLFLRLNRGLKLTPAAERYLRDVTAALDLISDRDQPAHAAR